MSVPVLVQDRQGKGNNQQGDTSILIYLTLSWYELSGGRRSAVLRPQDDKGGEEGGIVTSALKKRTRNFTGAARIRATHHNIKHNFSSSIIKIQEKCWWKTKERGALVTSQRGRHVQGCTEETCGHYLK